MRALLVLAVAACTPHKPAVQRVAAPAEGVSIMVYSSGTRSRFADAPTQAEVAFGVVDDRRFVEVTGSTITLDRIDPTAPLPSLVIEPIAARDLRVGACVRERIDPSAEALQRLAVSGDRTVHAPSVDESVPAQSADAGAPVGVLSPLVRCSVTGRPGRHLVRVLYVSPAIHYRTQHEIAVTAHGQATISTRFALATPNWGQRADIALFDGVPGGDEPPRELAHGTVVLDGGTALLSLPPRTIPATLRRVFDAAIRNREVSPTDVAWGQASSRAVWMWLELPDAKLPPGPVRVSVAIPGAPAREAIVPAALRERRKTTLRLPLWVDDVVQGVRRHWVDRSDSASITDGFQLAVSNAGDTPAEVWIEEHLRPAKRREVTRSAPVAPTLSDGLARTRVVVPAQGTERVSFTIRYEL